MGEKKQIVIVGGGITGLTAAYYLQKEIKANQLPYDVKLVEASHRLGGKVKTYRRDGFTIEQGPDSFLERKKPAVKLIKNLGLRDQLVRNGTGQSYILVGNKLHKMPSGSFMGIPTQVRPFLFSGIFSLKGKVRAGFDLALPKGKQQTDQSLGGFFRHRFGNELVENLIEPLLSGIYAGDIDQMSLMATFPNFYQVEQKYGSLIKGLSETMPKPAKKKKKKPGMFLSFAGGLQVLIDALETQLGDTVLLNTAVDHIEKKDHGYHVLLDSGEVYKADAVVIATPHYTVPKMFSQYDFFTTFNEIPATSVANVALAFDQSAIKKDIDGTGFVVSRNSDFRITACTWTHKKWPATTPDGKVLLRCYVGRPDDQSVVDLSDEEIVDIVLNDLNKTMDITQKPEFCVVSRWKNAMPQYTVGHLERIAKVRGEVSNRLPGLFLTGSSYEGIGLPDCIKQGEKAVAEVLAFLRE
ncbi:protoporphyrinogen oxidase [Virgibacillus dakarensis]|uniref:Coproporphyrinogen III oxidase n=1 Tax=Lentibacillus populi TaxID=1827502 RepID=A0A9W5TZL5_9BACI|nr:MULTISPECIES: protoporphyrinogen oxidase [Bacillaceae]MBT2215347.1 protoporphyrinogen oxidase [Virgibacillus dakarensis]MTW85484.1 protoporphyrinogen oxidase [Virgibacillus dakarensis]GGB51744.1 protoporphyrinogen oxidase [Lentibacillus populi]